MACQSVAVLEMAGELDNLWLRVGAGGWPYFDM